MLQRNGDHRFPLNDSSDASPRLRRLPSGIDPKLTDSCWPFRVAARFMAGAPVTARDSVATCQPASSFIP